VFRKQAPPTKNLPFEIDEVAHVDFLNNIGRLYRRCYTREQLVVVRYVFTLDELRGPERRETHRIPRGIGGVWRGHLCSPLYPLEAHQARSLRNCLSQSGDRFDIRTAHQRLVAPRLGPVSPEPRDPCLALGFELGDDLRKSGMVRRKEEWLRQIDTSGAALGPQSREDVGDVYSDDGASVPQITTYFLDGPVGDPDFAVAVFVTEPDKAHGEKVASARIRIGFADTRNPLIEKSQCDRGRGSSTQRRRQPFGNRHRDQIQIKVPPRHRRDRRAERERNVRRAAPARRATRLIYSDPAMTEELDMLAREIAGAEARAEIGMLARGLAMDRYEGRARLRSEVCDSRLSTRLEIHHPIDRPRMRTLYQQRAIGVIRGRPS
jgi:hypothetical protein